MTALRRVVVVGNGIAGVTAADTLRAQGYDGELTLVGDEPHAAYSRPALSKALLRDHDDLTSHLLPPPSHGATELRGVRATGLDVDARRVRLDNGDALPFDGVVIATGCRPRRLGDQRQDSDDVDGPHELTLRTLDDALVLRHRVVKRPAVVVIGGGPLGMEIASGALDAGCAVTLVSNGAPLSHQLGAHLAGLVGSAAAARGLRLETTGAARLERSDAGTIVVLRDGRRLEAEVVVTAIGDHANVEWLGDSGLLTGGALVADGHGRIAPGIVAAGDTTTIPTPYGLRRVPLWSAAIDQSRLAAAALLGVEPPAVDPRPYFWTEQFGLSLKAVGHLPFAGEPTPVEGERDPGSALLHWDGSGSAGGPAAAAVNVRIPIPRLRRLASA